MNKYKIVTFEKESKREMGKGTIEGNFRSYIIIYDDVYQYTEH